MPLQVEREIAADPAAREFWRDVAMCDCAVAERQGKALFFRFLQADPTGARSHSARQTVEWCANPYFEPEDPEVQIPDPARVTLLQWAWDLGWRLGVFLALEAGAQ